MSAIVKDTPSRLGSLILAWLLSQHDGGTPHQITKALQALLGDQGSDASRRRLIDDEALVLTRGGWITAVRKAAITLTAGGRRAALSTLDWKTLPAKADWRSIKKRLSARALELPFLRIEDGGAVDDRAAGLARHHRLAVGLEPTKQQVYDAFLWRACGVETDAPFTTTAAIQVLFNRMLGSSTPLPLEQALELLAAKAMAPELITAPPLLRVDPPATLPTDDGAFAARVLAAARASKTGRFGDDKVFISHVLRQLVAEGTAVGDTEDFKDRLVSVHRRSLLSLSRADLVEAMAPTDIEESESRYLSATFHFVRI